MSRKESAHIFLSLRDTGVGDHGQNFARARAHVIRSAPDMSELPDIISCEICGLLHRRTAVKCDGCDHTLGTLPDWSALRAEMPGLKRQMANGGAVLLAIIALNMALFGGAGYIVLLAPIGWAMDGALRYRSVSQQLRRAPRAPIQ